MQKISSYLYPNRVRLLANLAGFNVEYTSVYQRTINLFKGIDNVVEFDIINADQKRVDLTDLTLVFTMMDTEGVQLLQKELDVLDQTTSKGLATVTVLASDIMDLNKQYLHYSIYIDNEDGTQSMIYGDTRFTAKGTIELKGDAMPQPKPDRVQSLFSTMTDEDGNIILTSAALSPDMYLSTDSTVTTMAIYANELNGSVEVQTTLSPVLGGDTVWTTIETISVEETDTIIDRTYTGLYNWFRLKYTNGSTIATPVTGSIDKFIIRS